MPLAHALGASQHIDAGDLPGFGGTEPLARMSVDAFAENFAAHAVERPWIAVGHSMGAKIALAAAAKRSKGLVGLILVAPSPPTPQPMTDTERSENIRAFGDRAAARKQFATIAPGLPPALLATCVEDQLHATEAAWRWWLLDGSREDISARTRGLQLPALIIAGDNDRVLGTEPAVQLSRSLPNSALRIVTAAGHLVPLERPEAVARLVDNFVAKIAVLTP